MTHWVVRYQHRAITSDESNWEALPTDGVVYVESQSSGRISGHDHYWLDDDENVVVADHHDYDRGEPGWRSAPPLGIELPHDRHVLNGVMIPDEEWKIIINE